MEPQVKSAENVSNVYDTLGADNVASMEPQVKSAENAIEKTKAANSAKLQWSRK